MGTAEQEAKSIGSRPWGKTEDEPRYVAGAQQSIYQI